MTAPIRITPDTIEGYEVYRIVLDYEALHEGFIDRVDDLKVTRTGIDVAGGFAPGYSAKVLCNPPMKFLGRDSLGRDGLGKMLKATGMALVLVIDDERFAQVKAAMVQSKRPRKPAIAGIAKPTWLFTKKKAREMGKKRFSLMTDSERKRHQKKAAKARWKRKSVAPAASRAPEPRGFDLVRDASAAAVTAMQTSDCAE